MTRAPVAVLGPALGSLAASAGRLVEGGVADLCLFDPAAHWMVAPAALRSQGKHTPFAGHELPGRGAATVVAGHVAYEVAAALKIALRAIWRLWRAMLARRALGVLICAFAFPRLDAAQRMRIVGWWSARMLSVLGIGLHAAGTPRTGAGAVRRQPHLLARHPGDQCGAAGPLRLEGRRAPLAVAGLAGGVRRHPLHRARAQARRACGSCTRWPRR